MKPIPVTVAGLGLLLSLSGCHHQSAAAKAQADYQAKEKALQKQIEQNSKNLDQRVRQLEQQGACGPWLPGFPPPKTPADCAKAEAQWEQSKTSNYSVLHSTPAPKKPSTVPPIKH